MFNRRGFRRSTESVNRSMVVSIMNPRALVGEGIVRQVGDDLWERLAEISRVNLPPGPAQAPNDVSTVTINPSEPPQDFVVTLRTTALRDTALRFNIHKPLAWWVLFLHQPREFLHKFILDTLLGCHVSHICHWPPCLVLYNLELVLPVVNYGRTACKNGSHREDGGCQHPKSKHTWLKPCCMEKRAGSRIPLNMLSALSVHMLCSQKHLAEIS